MNIENISALCDLVDRHGLSVLEVEEENTKIKIEKTATATPVVTLPAPTPAIESAAPPMDEVDFNHLTEVKSPLVGIFYSAPSPDAMPFASIGSVVKKGDVLCIVEAMKLMNEITSEYDGEIVDICIKNGDIAEFGQVLFRMK